MDDAITKIGTLLVLGFGEAGSYIVTRNLSQFGNVNVKTRGNKTMAIFGFCDIRKFTNTTEALQERVMLFVNDIAKIVHGMTIEYLGIPNKNIGDAFMICWKIPQSEMNIKNKLVNHDSYLVRNTADLALITIVKILIKLKSEESIIRYSRDKDILRVVDSKYEVELGFGLHTGSAIEGTIGTEFKIDATYMSKDVEFASKLEEMTKGYGKPIILSNSMV